MKEHKFKKHLGQNFLKDKNIINKIVDLVSLNKDDLVIEVGAGSGFLTRELSEKAQVLAYEIDKDLEDELSKTKAKIIIGDFLKRDLTDDIESFKYKKLYFVSNLPYYITTAIVQKLINSKLDFSKIVIMIQKEVGERFLAKEKTRKYSSITVYLSYFYDLQKEFIVKKESFYPVPKVDSLVISLNKKEGRKADSEEIFFNLVRDSFSQKRKTLINNLKTYDTKLIKNYLSEHNLSESIRAEELNLDQFIDISNLINKHKD